MCLVATEAWGLGLGPDQLVTHGGWVKWQVWLSLVVSSFSLWEMGLSLLQMAPSENEMGDGVAGSAPLHGARPV